MVRPSRRISCVIDSDIIIDFLRQRDYAEVLLDNWAQEGLLAISAITHLEVYQGMRDKDEGITNSLFGSLTTLPVDIPIARQAGRMLRDMRARGIPVGIADAVIASTSLYLGTPLLTNNVAHYPFPELRVVRGLE